MGNQLNINTKFKALMHRARTAHSKIGETSYCPNCERQFTASTTYQTFDNHVEMCLLENPQQKAPIHPQTHELMLKDANGQWSKKLIKIDEQFLHAKPEHLQQKPTAQKILWLHHYLKEQKVHWNEGAEHLIFSHKSIVNDSMLLLKLDLYKQLKLIVEDDVVKDAGGLLREWVVMLLDRIIELGVWRMNKSGYFVLEAGGKFEEVYELVGALLAKVLIEKINIPYRFDHCFLSYLAGNPPSLPHLKTYDPSLYSSCHSILNSTSVEDLCLNFTILDGNECVELVPGGAEIALTNDNKDLFVDMFVSYWSKERVLKPLEVIKKSFNYHISKEVIRIFQAEELELIFNGVDCEEIKIEDWKEGTQYKEPLKPEHKVIKWFWIAVESMTPKERARLLKFVTGSQNLPVYGFKYRHLETNRGNTSPFVIEAAKYDKKKPFPIAHTCFNRLLLPLYPSQESLSQGLFSVLRCPFDGIWGLE